MTLIELLLLGTANILISLLGATTIYLFLIRDIAIALGVLLGLFCLNFVIFFVWVNLPKKTKQ